MNTLKRLARAKRKAKANRIVRAHKARGADVEFNSAMLGRAVFDIHAPNPQWTIGDFIKSKPHKWVPSSMFNSYKNEDMGLTYAHYVRALAAAFNDDNYPTITHAQTSEAGEGVSTS